MEANVVVHNGAREFMRSNLISFKNTLEDQRHAAYSYNIKCQKCAGMGLNGFIFKMKIKIMLKI